MRVPLTIAVLLAGCSSSPRPADPPPPSRVTPDAAFAAAPADAAPAAAGCDADEHHCCLPDGRVVVPGGCQPVHRDGEHAFVVRNDDGTCREIECEIRCLPATARIDTPAGEVAIAELAVGDPVWSVDERGAPIEARILAIGSRPVPDGHEIVEVRLADGRVVRASAGHPLAGGGSVGDLVAGAVLDGSTVAAVRTRAYDGARTWDLLPDGPTGAYRADGVLLGSTLAR